MEDGKKREKALIVKMEVLFGIGCFQRLGRDEQSGNLLRAPYIVQKRNERCGDVCLIWSRVGEAEGYVIYKYDNNKSKYKRYKVIKGKNNTKYLEKGGWNRTVKYKISAYKKENGKNVVGQQSCAV